LYPDQESIVLDLTNEARVQAGLPALSDDSRLGDLARSRSQDMGIRNYFAHTDPDGRDLFDFLAKLGSAYSSAGENIAMNTAAPSQTGRTAFSGWMGSAGHKANILRPTFGRLGVGVYRTVAGKTYLTQVFAN
jgi:uncharacterized protein YkwD